MPLPLDLEKWKLIVGPLADYLRSCPIPLDEKDVERALHGLCPTNHELNLSKGDRAAMALRTLYLHGEGSFLGDVARTPLDKMTPHDEDVLIAVTETASGLPERIDNDNVGWCIDCDVATLKEALDQRGRCQECDARYLEALADASYAAAFDSAEEDAEDT